MERMFVYPDCLHDGIFELFDDEIEIVPSVIGKESRVKGQSNFRVILFSVFPSEVLDLS